MCQEDETKATSVLKLGTTKESWLEHVPWSPTERGQYHSSYLTRPGSIIRVKWSRFWDPWSNQSTRSNGNLTRGVGESLARFLVITWTSESPWISRGIVCVSRFTYPGKTEQSLGWRWSYLQGFYHLSFFIFFSLLFFSFTMNWFCFEFFFPPHHTLAGFQCLLLSRESDYLVRSGGCCLWFK